MTVLDHARKLVADCDEELHFERRVKRALKCLIAEIERLESELESIGAGGVGPLISSSVQRNPLTDEGIKDIHDAIKWHEFGCGLAFARAIERAHGIGGEA